MDKFFIKKKKVIEDVEFICDWKKEYFPERKDWVL